MTDIVHIITATPAEKAAQLLKLKDVKKQVDSRIEALQAELLAVAQETGIQTIKTAEFTLSVATRVTPKVADYEKLKESLDEAGIPYSVRETFGEEMNSVFKALLKSDNAPAGLGGTVTEYIAIRTTKEKHA